MSETVLPEAAGDDQTPHESLLTNIVTAGPSDSKVTTNSGQEIPIDDVENQDTLQTEISSDSLSRSPSDVQAISEQFQIRADQVRAENLARLQTKVTRSKPRTHLSHLTIQLKSRKFTRKWSSLVVSAFVSSVLIISVVYWIEALPAGVQALLWADSAMTIFTVGLLSYLSVSLLDTLIITSCNNLRWSLCAQQGGISLLTFTTLGDVGPLDLLWLSFISGNKHSAGVRSSHRLWALQRYSV